jgi:hypothetical protein
MMHFHRTLPIVKQLQLMETEFATQVQIKTQIHLETQFFSKESPLQGW